MEKQVLEVPSLVLESFGFWNDNDEGRKSCVLVPGFTNYQD